MENNTEELYFDFKKDELHEKFPKKLFEELVELGVIKIKNHLGDGIFGADLCNMTMKEAVEKGIIIGD